ncbi:hypothetical protein MUK42_33417 [Musa troglodytarum]|uniref:Uncharacterized protein n=1 Tax=Musa troglodytarum TaxID=320322 RepID=A0A9E7FDD6_9LILI|nr:hypothetical protein MUK42_33417 [Musa troglodytarum]
MVKPSTVISARFLKNKPSFRSLSIWSSNSSNTRSFFSISCLFTSAASSNACARISSFSMICTCEEQRERETLALASSSSLSAFSPIWSNSALASSANWVRNADRSSRKSVRRTFWACSMAIRASSSCFRLSPSDGEEESARPASLELQKQETDLRLLRDVFLWVGDGFGRWRDGWIALRMLMISRYNRARVSGIVRLPFRLRKQYLLYYLDLFGKVCN